MQNKFLEWSVEENCICAFANECSLLRTKFADRVNLSCKVLLTFKHYVPNGWILQHFNSNKLEL